MTALLLVTWNDDNNYTQLNTDFSFSTIVNVVYILYIVEYIQTETCQIMYMLNRKNLLLFLSKILFLDEDGP